jgi:hypothetical protein
MIHPGHSAKYRLSIWRANWASVDNDFAMFSQGEATSVYRGGLSMFVGRDSVITFARSVAPNRRRGGSWIAATIVMAMVTLNPLSSMPAQASGIWGNAIQVPGMATANLGDSVVNDIWCGHAGDCVAGGQYVDSSGAQQAFVVDQVNGVWGSAQTTAVSLNLGGSAAVYSISCSVIGDCTAGGTYTDLSGNNQAFVADSSGATWSQAQGIATTLNAGGGAAVISVSCASPGNSQAFVDDKRNGTWGPAVEVPGTSSLNLGALAVVTSVSCSSNGNCSAVGLYTVSSTVAPAFVVDEVNGVWGTAVQYTNSLFPQAQAVVINEISCSSGGNCGAAGSIIDASKKSHPFVANETNGQWGGVVTVSAIDALSSGTTAIALSISCTSTGNCSAGGTYTDVAGTLQAFVVDEAGGQWQPGEPVPQMSSVNVGGAEVYSVSCSSAGNCSAGGQYIDGAKVGQAFVVDETKSTWGAPLLVPGSVALDTGGNATVFAVSCSSDGGCGAGGQYVDGAKNAQAMVFDLTPPPPTVPGAPTNVRVVVGRSQLTVKWLAPANDGGSPITRYTVTSRPGNKSCSTTGALSCTVKGLKSSQKYSFKVTATNAVGTSQPSSATRTVKPR